MVLSGLPTLQRLGLGMFPTFDHTPTGLRTQLRSLGPRLANLAEMSHKFANILYLQVLFCFGLFFCQSGPCPLRLRCRQPPPPACGLQHPGGPACLGFIRIPLKLLGSGLQKPHVGGTPKSFPFPSNPPFFAAQPVRAGERAGLLQSLQSDPLDS